MIGQEKLSKILENITLQTLPHSLILYGDRGCGKHLFCDLLSKKLNVEQIDITDSLNLETVEQIYLKAEPILYIVNVPDITVKSQNVLLKLLEEPTKYAYIILLVENKNLTISTIKNRCQIWEFEKYSKSVLSSFGKFSDLELSIANTPGKLKDLHGANIQDIMLFIDKILTKIRVATLPNTLKLQTYINFKNDKDKIDISLFNDVLQYYMSGYVKQDRDKCIEKYKIVNNYLNKCNITHSDKRYLFDELLINLWSLK